MSYVPPAVSNWSVLPLYWHELVVLRKKCCRLFRFVVGKSVFWVFHVPVPVYPWRRNCRTRTVGFVCM